MYLLLEIKTNTFDDNIYEKLKEAEQQMISTSKRYSKKDVLDSINNIIG